MGLVHRFYPAAVQYGTPVGPTEFVFSYSNRD